MFKMKARGSGDGDDNAVDDDVKIRRFKPGAEGRPDVRGGGVELRE